MSLGYTQREWEFLALAATWSGYFVPRQFDQFGGGSPGAVTHAMVQKLLAQGHATVSTHTRNAHLYHLSARPLYAALRQENNRHRRKRPAHQVRVKLMALDFVLARRDLLFLSSEQDKIEHFSQLGVEPRVLPQRSYTATRGAASTRYFLDKFPLFRCGDQVGFSFISGDASSRAPFLTYLAEHWPLFSALRSVPLIYVTARPELAAVAAADLRAYREKQQGGELADRAAFFTLRKRHEGAGPELSITELRALRAGLQKYGTRDHEALFRAGSASTDPAHAVTGPDIRMETVGLPHRYDLFGDL